MDMNELSKQKSPKGFEDLHNIFKFFVDKKRAEDMKAWLKSKFSQGKPQSITTKEESKNEIDHSVMKMLSKESPNTNTNNKENKEM